MSKVEVIYWSGTGNTEMMAKAVMEGIESRGVAVSLKEVADATLADVKEADAVVFGSPSMGDEELAEEMEEFVSEIEKAGITGKVAGTFGSYDWGDGEWMRDFMARLRKDGFDVVEDGLIVELIPNEEELEECRQYGKEVVRRVER